MIPLLIAAALGLLLSIFGTPYAIRALRGRKIGQFIQEDIQGQHAHKQGTPTMGGLVFVSAAVIGWFLAHLQVWTPDTGFTLSTRPFGPGGWLAVLALVGMGAVGLLDDWVKYTRQRSLGLSKATKFGGQLAIAALFAFLASNAGIVTQVSFVQPLGEQFDLGVFFVVWVLLMLTGAANGVNLADGMDGLAGGASALVIGAYTIIAFWQYRNSDAFRDDAIYQALSPLELAMISAAMFGALLGFLWWNAPPAKIFMGDVGSQGIGGLLAALALLTNTHLLLALIGAIFVAETLSVIVQVASFRLTGKRVLRMSPLHFHFDLGGWPETTVVIRFWILTGIGVALGLGLFYADFLRFEGIL